LDLEAERLLALELERLLALEAERLLERRLAAPPMIAAEQVPPRLSVRRLGRDERLDLLAERLDLLAERLDLLADLDLLDDRLLTLLRERPLRAPPRTATDPVVVIFVGCLV
jgi:hypothetical protein